MDKLPTRARLLIRNREEFPVVRIHFNTNLVTLQEGDKVFNTVSIKCVEFDFSNFTKEEQEEFFKKFNQELLKEFPYKR